MAAWLGLTTRRYPSGEVDYDGHISRRGDAHVRGLLYEAATVMLTRTHAECGLRAWGALAQGQAWLQAGGGRGSKENHSHHTRDAGVGSAI